MAAAQRPSTDRRTTRSTPSSTTTARGGARKAGTVAARGGRATAAAPTARRRSPRKVAAAPTAAPVERESGMVRWTAMSVPIVHARVPLPSLRRTALTSVPGGRAMAAQARWAARTAKVNVPSRDYLLYYGGVGAMALVGVLDWPVALVAGAGVWVVSRAVKANPSGPSRDDPGVRRAV